MRASSDREAEPYFSHPFRQILAMLGVLVLVGFGAYLAFPNVAPVFLANPLLNGFIGIVFVFGVIACFWQIIQLFQSVSWIEGYVAEKWGHEMVKAPRLLAPLAALLRSRKSLQISATSQRSILDSVATRIDEARDITRYIVNLLIFLGLLGTFYGLATTVPAIVETIRGLAPTPGEDGMAVFQRLMSGLEAQLGGMGVAFASSLLGLAGSLVVGLLELFASQTQNRFYRELEEWLSSITRLGFAGGEGDGASEPGLAAAMVEQVAEQIDRLQALFVASDESRARVDGRLGALAGGIERLADRIEADAAAGPALERLAEGQERLAEVLEAGGGGGGGIDAESRSRLRSIDVQLLRLLEEVSAGRHESTAELREALREVGRAVRNGHGSVEPVRVAGGKG